MTIEEMLTDYDEGYKAGYRAGVEEMGIESKKAIPLRKYTNGMEVYDIDSHPHGKIYRDPHNNVGIVCFPNESLMLLNPSGCVVLFITNISELNNIEVKMNLIRE